MGTLSFLFSFLVLFASDKCLAAWSEDEKTPGIISLTDKDWSRTLEGEWMIKFYAPWCSACQSSKADYERFAELAQGLDVNVAKVDITQYPTLSGRFLLTYLPSIYHSVNGEYRRFEGDRRAEGLRDYILQKKWKKDDPVAWFRHPNSILMSLVAIFFTGSIFFKKLHEMFQQHLGVSHWVSYFFFASMTVTLGTVCGMFMVYIYDTFFPSKAETETNEKTTDVNENEPCKEVEEKDSDAISEENTVEEKEHSEKEEEKVLAEKQSDEGEKQSDGEEKHEKKIEVDKDEIKSQDEKVTQTTEEDTDVKAEESQSSLQSFRSWEKISDKDIVDTDELRRRNVQSTEAITEISPENSPTDSQICKTNPATDEDDCKKNKDEASAGGDIGHSKTE